MNREMSHEMFERLFDSDIFLLPEKNEEIHSFCLDERTAEHIKLLVLLKDESSEKASTADIELLNKIADFKDYHLKRGEVVVLNLVHQVVSLKRLKNEFAPVNIIAFGISPSEINMKIEHRINRVVRFGGMNFVFTSSLKEISGNEKLKKQFFLEALKPMFSSLIPIAK